MKYNPFEYIRSEKDILKLVNTLIANTKGEGEKSSEDFWVKAERLYYCALIGYIWYEAPDEEKNIITLLDMINASEAKEDDENYKSPVDLLFDRLEEKEPEHFAVKQYKKYKMAAGVVCSKRLLNQAVGKSLRTHNLKPVSYTHLDVYKRQALDWYIICTFTRWYNKKHQRRNRMSKVGFVRNSIYEKGLKKMARA